MKSGCQIEKLQLESRNRLESALALYMIITWRILYIKTLGRLLPDARCDVIFEQEEWQVIYLAIHNIPPPKTPPPLQELMIMLAKLGGYLNRKSDSYPGTKVLWMGMQRAHDLISGFKLAKEIFSGDKRCV